MNTLTDNRGILPEARSSAGTFVCCLVDSEWQALNIVGQFRAGGFSKSEISVLFPSRSDSPSPSPSPRNGAEPQHAAGIAWDVLDGALGWLSGFSAFRWPPLAPFLGAGPIMVALSGSNQRSVGDITAPLRTFGIAENRAPYYAERLTGGEILIAAHAADLCRTQQAEKILCHFGAKDIGYSAPL